MQDKPLTYLGEEDYNCNKVEESETATWLYIGGLTGEEMDKGFWGVFTYYLYGNYIKRSTNQITMDVFP